MLRRGKNMEKPKKTQSSGIERRRLNRYERAVNRRLSENQTSELKTLKSTQWTREGARAEFDKRMAELREPSLKCNKLEEKINLFETVISQSHSLPNVGEEVFASEDVMQKRTRWCRELAIGVKKLKQAAEACLSPEEFSVENEHLQNSIRTLNQSQCTTSDIKKCRNEMLKTLKVIKKALHVDKFEYHSLEKELNSRKERVEKEKSPLESKLVELNEQKDFFLDVERRHLIAERRVLLKSKKSPETVIEGQERLSPKEIDNKLASNNVALKRNKEQYVNPPNEKRTVGEFLIDLLEVLRVNVVDSIKTVTKGVAAAAMFKGKNVSKTEDMSETKEDNQTFEARGPK